MEQDFLTSLKGAGITTVTSDILKEEHILNFDVFASLEEEHFTVLRSKIKIGQHALLLRLWHQRNRMERSSENPLSPTPSTASSSLMAVKSPSPAVRDESIRDNIKELADLYKKRGSGMPQQNVKGGDLRRMTLTKEMNT
ncbi:PREDICTED: uncharacterized protein LOC109581099 [Amphimedon queenslandica]|uniref:Uncharacterized protein n=1 Tax=Amphimedon queenslandica TaxID=400682 RepID=A0AAN0J132_AMPQE|nr:PREDICTED: uncharacterized protein LOC109581099 [Amphimedon queenslandica]|eukprot:XP_019850436.1 PREDICTED: uncharacterized protein LOC109581099 [Amphimedon queenslandica]